MPEDGYIFPALEIGTGISGIAGGSTGFLPPFEGLGFGDNAFIARRGDHLGLTLAGRVDSLAERLPQGVVYWAGFFTETPDRRGIGGSEVSVGGYARQPVSQWSTAVVGASARRTNARSLIWPEPGLTTGVTVVAWGVWDAETDGVLRAFDYLRADAGTPRSFTFGVGDRPAIEAGGIGLTL